MGSGSSSVSAADITSLQSQILNLAKDNEGLREAIKQMDLLQQLKNTNVYVKGAVVAVSISLLLGFYAVKRYGENLERSGEGKEHPYLLSEPWRRIHQTLKEDSKLKEYFVERILELLPKNHTTLNILLLGQAGSGKSSFVNACKTALLQEERVCKQAIVGPMGADSITQRLSSYELEIKTGVKKKHLPVQLFDCRGLFEGNRGVQTEDIKKICEGHIKAEYMIDSQKPIKSGDKKYRENPLQKDKIHCIVYVLAADEDGFVQGEVAEQLKEIKKMFRDDTPQLILLTKIDRIGIDDIPDITQIFRAKRVKERCEEAAAFLNFCVNDVFPQSSYSDEVVPCEYKDLITLFNINTIMERANDRVNEPVLSDDDTLTS